MKEDRVEWLKKQVVESGFNYDAIADAVGRDRTTVWRWLNGKTISASKMKLIADILGIDLRNHFEGFDTIYNQPEKKDYRLKYLELLEKHTEVQEELSEYKKIVKRTGTESGQNEE